jgi:predicted GH43/DUF377 family glycosyl hydrolase
MLFNVVVGLRRQVFGPFDCQNSGACDDDKGTEDPRLTYDAENEQYVLLYNAWGHSPYSLRVATTKDPTSQTGWTRHGPIFPADAKLDGWPGKSGSIVTMPSGPHYVIWGCASALRITPSVGRSMLRWDYNKSKVLLSVRKAPFWDTGFVESAMPPLMLKDGNLLFFYDSVGPWNGTSTLSFQPGWAVLSGKDPSVVLARASVPPLPNTLPWEAGARPTWPCNRLHVSNLGGGHPVDGPNQMGGDDLFRVYFGGADAVVGSALVSVKLAPLSGKFRCEREGGMGLSQCVPDASSGLAGFAACNASCGPPKL